MKIVIKWGSKVVNSESVTTRNLSKKMVSLVKKFSEIRHCHQIQATSHSTALSEHFNEPAGTVISDDGTSTSKNIVKVSKREGKFESLNCPGYVLAPVNIIKPRCVACSKLDPDISRTETSNSLSYSWKRLRTIEEMRSELSDRKIALESMEKKVKDELNRLREIHDDPVVRNLVDCIERGNLEDEAKAFYEEQFKIRNRHVNKNFHWTDFPTTFSFFEEIAEFGTSKSYDIFSKGKYVDGFFKGILAAPSKKVLNTKLGRYKYLPGLTKAPLILVQNALESLGFVEGYATLLGDDITLKKGLDRLFLKNEKSKPEPFWFGRVCVDSYDHLVGVNGKYVGIIDLLKREYQNNNNPKEDSPHQSRCRHLVNCLEYIVHVEKRSGIATKACQFFLNICGKFRDQKTGKSEVKRLKFPLFWFAHNGFDNKALAALISAAAIYTQQNLTTKNLVIDSICWDGDPAVQSFVKSFSKLANNNNNTDSDSVNIDPNISNVRLRIPFLDNVIYFVNDSGHLIKNMRNEMYGIFKKETKKEKDKDKDIRFPVLFSSANPPNATQDPTSSNASTRSTRAEFHSVKLFPVIHKLLECFKEGDHKLDCRINSNHVELSTYSKMNQSLCSDVFSKSTLRVIQNSLLSRLLGKKTIRSLEEESEGEDEEDNSLEEKRTSWGLDLLEKVLVEDYSGEEASSGDFFLIRHDKFFPTTSYSKNILKKREEALGFSLNELLATMNLISFWIRFRNIFKSRALVTSHRDWRVSRVRSLDNFLKFYVDDIKSNFGPKTYRMYMISEEYVLKARRNCYVFTRLAQTRKLEWSPILVFSQDPVETHFSCIRMNSGLDQNPSVVGYFHRQAHAILRLQTKIRELTYDFSPNMTKEKVVREAVFSRKVCNELKNYHEEMIPIVHRKMCRALKALKERLGRSNPSYSLNEDMSVLEWLNISYVTGYCIKQSRSKYRNQTDVKNFKNFFVSEEQKENRNTVVPKDEIVQVVSIFHSVIESNLNYLNMRLYPEVIELGLFESFSEKFVEEFHKYYRGNQTSRSSLIAQYILKRLIKILVYRKFKDFDLLVGKLQKAFRKVVSSKTE